MTDQAPPSNDESAQGAFAPLPGAAYLDADLASLAGLLEWYDSMGVDLALEEEAIDRFAAPKSAAPSMPAQPAARASAQSASPGMIANPLLQEETKKTVAPQQNLAGKAEIEVAQKTAAGANTLDELREALIQFDACPLKRHADKLVFGEGPADARSWWWAARRARKMIWQVCPSKA